MVKPKKVYLSGAGIDGREIEEVPLTYKYSSPGEEAPEPELTVDAINAMSGFDDLEKALLIDLVSSEAKQMGASIEVREQLKSELGDPLSIMSQWFLQGDCFEIMPTLEAERFDVIVTDPPYGIDINTTTADAEIGVFDDSPEWVFQNMPKFLKACWRVLKPDSHMYLFFALGDPMHPKGSFFDFITREAKAIGFEIDPLPFIWMKGSSVGKSGSPTKYPGRCYELIMYLRKGNLPLTVRGLGNIFIHDPIHGVYKIHPTEKPKNLIKDLLLRSIHHNHVEILDPMAGSGVTLLAGMEKGLRVVGIEKDPQYYARGLERLADFFDKLSLPHARELAEGWRKEN